jgi:lipid II:glycine glycyltransferase (peptidoglycan interpeptide bridge formation enzyme)
LVGRANRYLHWQDLLRLRESGCTALDLGGWHPGDDTELLKINKFKEEFGGKVVEIYNSMMGISLKGKAALKLLALKRML